MSIFLTGNIVTLVHFKQDYGDIIVYLVLIKNVIAAAGNQKIQTLSQVAVFYTDSLK